MESINLAKVGDSKLNELLVKYRRAEWVKGSDAREYSAILKEIRYRRGY